MKKYVLFDLDGTLLPMDNLEFTDTYFKGVSAALAPHGYDPKELVATIWTGTKAMVMNDGNECNEAVFWKAFAKVMGEKSLADKVWFDEFYRNEFDELKKICGYNPVAREVVDFVKESGSEVVLATNPLFPSIATEKRISWAGFQLEEFVLYTTYENINYCKPNPDYYKEILKRIGADPKDCLMVGNDVTEDMVAQTLGMDVFLITDHMINKEDKDISVYPNGSFSDLLRYLKEQD